ncbi:MAG: hypothetical protein LBE89_08485, partial [Helicobacteraceae bacterium]|nr:hypothetical protein [Helicobacteraceae bacterium]
SYSTGNISGTWSAGGIAGDVHASGSIANSYSTGNVNGICAGGIAGFVEYGGSITNSYSTGNISGESVGGIAGGVNDGVIITNCAAANGRITGGVLDRDDCYTGHRILGNGGVSGLSNNFANSDMTIQPPMVSCARDSSSNGIDKPLEELKTRSTYENAVDDGSGGLGWKFGDDDSNPWKIDAGKNNGFPYLYWQEF